MYEKRIAALRARLAGAGLPALLVSHPTNMLYLSGFRGSAGYLLITERERLILTDFRYHERVRREVDPGYELFDISGMNVGADVLPELTARLGLQRIGFETEYVTVKLLEQLRAGGVNLEPTDGWVEGLRETKDSGEIVKLRSATLLTERLFGELLAVIAPGVRECDLAAEFVYRALKAGASGVSFAPIIASGVNSALPHHGTGNSELVPAAPLTIDIGLILDDYCSDMTRTVFIGDCPPRWREVYAVVLEAKDRALPAIRPGVLARDVDKVARDYISAQGFGEYFGHGLGHGVGLPFKGAPILHWASGDLLKAGHVASNEPGIYLPGEGGVRIEDLFVVTETGADYLGQLDTKLMVL